MTGISQSIARFDSLATKTIHAWSDLPLWSIENIFNLGTHHGQRNNSIWRGRRSLLEYLITALRSRKSLLDDPELLLKSYAKTRKSRMYAPMQKYDTLYEGRFFYKRKKKRDIPTEVNSTYFVTFAIDHKIHQLIDLVLT